MLPFLKKHYEKVILGVLLAVFVILLVLHLFLVQGTGEIKRNRDANVRFNTAAIDNEKMSQFDSARVLAFYEKWEARHTGKDAESEFVDLVLPYPMTICPQCRRAIPVRDFQVKQGSAYICSLAQHSLIPAGGIVEEENTDKDKFKDSDNDGIPDSYEKREQKRDSRFNADNKSDADADFDNDFYTNLEEYICDTDPLNPALASRNGKASNASRFAGRLPYHHLLRVLDAEKRKVYSFELINVSGSSANFKIWENRTRGRRNNARIVQVQVSKWFKSGSRFSSRNDRIRILNVANGKVSVQDEVTGEILTVERKAVTKARKAAVELYSRVQVRKYNKKDSVTGKFVPGDPFVGSFILEEKERFVLGNFVTGTEEYMVASIDEAKHEIKITGSGKTITITKEESFHAILANAKKKKEEEQKKEEEKIRNAAGDFGTESRKK